jgi:hypothetical protein
MAVTDYAPSPQETAQWGVRRRNAVQGYARQNAQNNFDRGNFNANRAGDTANLTQQYQQMRNRLPGTFAGRGLLGSGISAQGFQDYGTQRTNAFGDLGRKYQQMLGQTDLNAQNYAEDYTNQMSDVAQEEANRRAELAAQIRSVY